MPAGAALAVDRERFSSEVTQRDRVASADHAFAREEIPRIPRGARWSGDHGDRAADVRRRCQPTSRRWSAPSISISTMPISPIVLAESIDRSKVFRASRWGRSLRALGDTKYGVSQLRAAEPDSRVRPAPATAAIDDGEGDYLNCPFTAEEYSAFYDALMAAEKAAAARVRRGEVLRRVPADRGDGGARRGHAALRADEARRPARSAHRPRGVRRRPAAAGQPGGRSLQPGRVSDADEVGRAGARAAS